MAEAGASTRTQNRTTSRDENRLKYGCDGGFLSGAHLDDDDRDSNDPLTIDSGSCDSTCESTRLPDLATSLRVFSESLLSMELAEMEMVKAREVLRYEAEKRRVESETELTRMLLQTQLQVTSFVAGQSSRRKRKRVGEDKSSERKRALVLNLLRSNFMF